MDEFCWLKFWNSDLTWNIEILPFSPCFEKTVFVWIPCVFLLLLSSFDIYLIVFSKAGKIPWNYGNISKILLTCLLMLLSIVEFTYSLKKWINGDENAIIDMWGPFFKFISFAVVLILTICQIRTGIRSSAILFIFWILSFICGTFQFISVVKKFEAGEDYNLLDMTFVGYYGANIILLILNFFGDKPPKESNYSYTKKPRPENGASFPAKLFFSWFDNFIYVGSKTTVDKNDLWDLNHDEMASKITHQFEKYWRLGTASANGTTFGKHYSILPGLCRVFATSYILISFLELLRVLLVFVSPFLIVFADGVEPRWHGYLYCTLLFIVVSLQTLLNSQHSQNMILIGMKTRTAIISAIYRKTLRLSNSARKESTVGEIVNLMSIDAQRLMDFLPMANMIWTAPLQVLLVLYFLWQTLGLSTLTASAVIITHIVITGFVASRLKILHKEQIGYADKRAQLINEIFAGIKVLKLYAWESSFGKEVVKIREKEIKIMKKLAHFNAVYFFLIVFFPSIVSLATLAAFVLSDENNILDAKKAFVALSLLNIIKIPLFNFPMAASNAVQVWMSLKRINKFMSSDEVNLDAVSHDDNAEDALVMENCTFKWDKETPILKNITMRVKSSSLVAVVGTLGSGKSSLISAFLGEMIKINGCVNTKGSIAYVSQTAWIQNATIQDNITFGKAYNKEFYDTVVEACCLKSDFKILQEGDQTEIGEKGINLSGGQKQRISLARAVYSISDNYFLDDPLSALDIHVGKEIFDNVIGPKGILKNKTRIFVTNFTQVLPEVDNIIVLKDGSITEVGTYKELLVKKGERSDFLTSHILENEIKNKQDFNQGQELVNCISSNRRLTRKDEEKLGTNKLIKTENTTAKNINWNVYKHYIKLAGPLLTVAVIFFNISYQVFIVGSNIWLSVWSSDTQNYKNMSKRLMYLGGYAAFTISQLVFILLASYSSYFATLKAAILLHNGLFYRMLRAPMSFFDATPLGRILNRLTNDVNTIDNVLPVTTRFLAAHFFWVIGTLVAICYSTPKFIIGIIPLAVICFFIQHFYVPTSQELRKLELASRSPIISHFTESIQGLTTIRAYGATSRFSKESEDNIDFNQKCIYPGITADRWLAVRMEMIANLIIFFSAFLNVMDDSNSPGLVGLSITYALQISYSLHMMVPIEADFRSHFIVVEKIKEYSEMPQEASWEVTPNVLSENWPTLGNLEFRDYKVRYRDGLDFVLKGISCKIYSEEKVGIVGRTGAGKSSMTLSLFRLLEASEGAIYIDSIDISKLGLHTLRSKITIIPQDPVLFSGTLRFNLDPFMYYTDKQLWKALELAHLKSYVTNLPAKLDYEVDEGGENLSVGQRQLVCLARALLRKTKILVLDEATAAIDIETDDLIQKTIRSEFTSCTVLTIAHRINTIMDSDRVLVLDNGRIVEFDKPDILLKNKSSIFYGMAKAAGLTLYSKL